MAGRRHDPPLPTMEIEPRRHDREHHRDQRQQVPRRPHFRLKRLEVLAEDLAQQDQKGHADQRRQPVHRQERRRRRFQDARRHEDHRPKPRQKPPREHDLHPVPREQLLREHQPRRPDQPPNEPMLHDPVTEPPPQPVQPRIRAEHPDHRDQDHRDRRRPLDVAQIPRRQKRDVLRDRQPQPRRQQDHEHGKIGPMLIRHSQPRRGAGQIRRGFFPSEPPGYGTLGRDERPMWSAPRQRRFGVRRGSGALDGWPVRLLP